MAEIKNFKPVKLICGLIFSSPDIRERATKLLEVRFGSIDLESPAFSFNYTNYYEREMGQNLRRVFLSFSELISPELLPEIKISTNSMEKELTSYFPEIKRPVNLDPGYLTPAALIMATTKDFSHRIPLSKGIYAHLEFLFTRKGFKFLEWTYPDFHQSGYQEFFQNVRKIYLSQLKKLENK